MGMNENLLGAVDTGFSPAVAAAGDRVRECEAAIERILQRHNCRLTVAQLKIDGAVLRQEIIVTDARA